MENDDKTTLAEQGTEATSPSRMDEGAIPKEWSLRRIGQMYKERRTKVSDKDYDPLSVTMKGPGNSTSEGQQGRIHDGTEIMEWAFRTFSEYKNPSVLRSYEIPVFNASYSRINLVPAYEPERPYPFEGLNIATSSTASGCTVTASSRLV